MERTIEIISAEEQIRFLLYIQRLLAEGQFTSTYKFALLLSIANLCVEKDFAPEDPVQINSHELAEHFINIYWRQAIPFNDDAVLKQNTGQQAAIINYIIETRKITDGSLSKLKTNRKLWSKLITKVASTIVKMPLWKLQNLGGESINYLYDESRSRRTITLKPGIGFCFRLFHGLVTELVQSAWLQFVSRQQANRKIPGVSSDLESFMFGSDRSILGKFAPILRDFQKDTCFYCTGRLRDDDPEPEVDHFIPWSRYNLDLGHNFVLAHRACNLDKLDRLAGMDYLKRWADRNEADGEELGSEFQNQGLIYDLPKTIQVARFAYEQAEISCSNVWLGRKNRLEQLTTDWRSIIF